MKVKSKLSIQIVLVCMHIFILYNIITNKKLGLILNVIGFAIGSYAFESPVLSGFTILLANFIKYSEVFACIPFIGTSITPFVEVFHKTGLLQKEEKATKLNIKEKIPEPEEKEEIPEPEEIPKKKVTTAPKKIQKKVIPIPKKVTAASKKQIQNEPPKKKESFSIFYFIADWLNPSSNPKPQPKPVKPEIDKDEANLRDSIKSFYHVKKPLLTADSDNEDEKNNPGKILNMPHTRESKMIKLAETKPQLKTMIKVMQIARLNSSPCNCKKCMRYIKGVLCTCEECTYNLQETLPICKPKT